MKIFSRLFWVSIILMVAACAPKRVEVPLQEERSIDVVMAERMSIKRIDATLSVVFEKADTEMYGDAVLDITREGDLHLKVYTLGILGMDLTSKNGVVKSTPRLDKHRTAILSQGLRDSLFWWDLKEYGLQEEGEFLVLRNDTRAVWLDAKTMLPKRQQIRFDEGKILNVLYDNPALVDGVWYQSKMRIELTRYAVTLTVKEISFLKSM